MEAGHQRGASQTFPSLTLTSQPFLYEVPQQVGGLAAGTILLAGMIMPADRSRSRIVIYKSTDRGSSWSFLSTVDTGDRAVYDPSPSSTTTTVWEPAINLDSSGNLVVYYSDERQKASGVLQAVVYRRSTDGGLTWGSVTNVAAVGNQSDRPGMITVARLGNGQYIPTERDRLAAVPHRPGPHDPGVWLLHRRHRAPQNGSTYCCSSSWPPARSISSG